MSNTHKIHSQASADGAPSIIHPAGGLEGLPRPEGRLGWQWGWQGRKRQCEGRRPWGFHTCSQGQKPQAGVGPAHHLCSSTSGQVGLVARAHLGRVGRSDHLCSAKAEGLELPQRPGWSGANNRRSAGCFHPLAHWFLTLPPRKVLCLKV